MEDIIVRPKYQRQTSNNRRKRPEPQSEMLSTVFAAKLLVVVVFLSVFALCKAANNSTTDLLISKVKVITSENFDSNKYISQVTNAMGLQFPQDSALSQDVSDKSTGSSDLNSSVPATAQGNAQNPDVLDSTASGEDNGNTASVGITGENGQVQILDDAEIKAIANKYAFIIPIKGEIAAPFGTITDFSGNTQFHSGIDIEANKGTSIKAALAGEITEAGSSPEYGNYIKITHNDGISTVYAHCYLLVAKKGQKVNQGDIIAKVGDTEGLSGADLHFEVWKDNKAADPEKLLSYLNQ
jgi:murein DD-endopeptidase MepM/ murein hydrolase activator NlpD